MKISVRVRDMEWSNKLQKEVERIVGFAIDRFRPQLSAASIYLTDLNGAKGGVDKLCQITATLHGRSKPVQILAQASEILPAVYRAARRLRHRVGSRIRQTNQPIARRFRASVRTVAYEG